MSRCAHCGALDDIVPWGAPHTAQAHSHVNLGSSAAGSCCSVPPTLTSSTSENGLNGLSAVCTNLGVDAAEEFPFGASLLRALPPNDRLVALEWLCAGSVSLPAELCAERREGRGWRWGWVWGEETFGAFPPFAFATWWWLAVGPPSGSLGRRLG